MPELPPRTPWLRRRFAFNLGLACIAALLSACSPAPDYQLSDGQTGNFSDWRGRWVVINYWASWCKPCLEEMPELAQFAEHQAPRALVFGVNYDNPDPAELARQINALKVGIPVPVLDFGPALGLARPTALPTTYILNPEGKLVATLKGPQTEASLLRIIDAAP